MEFAAIGLAFVFSVVGVLEIGWQITVSSALDSAAQRAGRFGVTGQQTRTGAPATISCRSDTIRWMVSSTAGGILRPERLTVTTAAFGSASGLGGASTPGAGVGGQVVTYSLRYEEPFLTGLWLQLVGGPDRIVHQASLVVKNEMFANATC